MWSSTCLCKYFMNERSKTRRIYKIKWARVSDFGLFVEFGRDSRDLVHGFGNGEVRGGHGVNLGWIESGPSAAKVSAN